MKQKEAQFWQSFLNDGPEAWQEAEKVSVPISVPPKARAIIDSMCERGKEAGEEVSFEEIAGDVFDRIIEYGIHTIANTIFQKNPDLYSEE
ncbi:hypothetical protein ACFL2O_06625 [Thermodesulfobacteriota bacterium]